MNEEVQSPGAAGENATPAAYYALFVLASVNLICSADRLIIGVLLEPIRSDLQLNDTQMGVLSGLAYAVFNSLALVPIGMLADRFSRRKVIAACLTVWSAATALGSIAQSFAQLALLRAMVGLGEAGNSAPGISMIADYFPETQRARAISVFFIASSLGMLVTFAGGGWIAEHHGWRIAILAAGVPGLALALLLWLTVKDPPRRSQPGIDAPLPLRQIGRIVAARPSVLHGIFAIGLINFVAAAIAIWSSAFLIRSHGFSVASAGYLMAVIAVAGMTGAYAGGKLCDRFAPTDSRWLGWIPAVATALTLVPIVGFLTAINIRTVVAWYILFGFLQTVYLAPAFNLVQTVIPARVRATVNSFTFLLSGLFGFGLGPSIAGAVSNFLQALGADSLRYSLLLVSIVLLWSAFHFFRTARTVRADVMARGNP